MAAVCVARSCSTRCAQASASGVEIVCAELKKEQERAAFAAAEFALARRRITPGALRALVTAFADDIAELAAACQQLLADAADEITEPLVERYYSGRVETNAFRVADIAIAGRYGEALVLLRHALASGADPVPIVAAFASKIRTMAKVSGQSRKRRPARRQPRTRPVADRCRAAGPSRVGRRRASAAASNSSLPPTRR